MRARERLNPYPPPPPALFSPSVDISAPFGFFVSDSFGVRVDLHHVNSFRVGVCVAQCGGDK